MQDKWQLNGFFTPAQLKRWYGAAPKRYSCRKMGEKPTVSQWTALSYVAARCCLKGVRIVMGECDPKFFSPSLLPRSWITGVQRFAALIIDETAPNSRLFAGISGEAFILEAAANGVGTVWVAATYRKKDCPIKLRDNEQVVAVIALGQPEGGWPETVERKRKSLEKICQGDYTAWPQWAKDAAECVRIAPSALNGQPWQLAFSGGSLALMGSARAQLDMGIALLHMEAAISQPHVWVPGGSEKEIARVRLI